MCVVCTLPDIVQTLDLALERQVRYVSVHRGGGRDALPCRTVAHLPSWRKTAVNQYENVRFGNNDETESIDIRGD